jgi:hypothetical protein
MVTVVQAASKPVGDNLIVSRQQEGDRAVVVLESFVGRESIPQHPAHREDGHVMLRHGGEVVVGREQQEAGDFSRVSARKVRGDSAAQ